MRRSTAVLAFLVCGVAAVSAGCGDDGAPESCAPPLPADGDRDGHAEPLGAGPTEARAGRLTSPVQLPATTYGTAVWRVGDLVLANDRVALVIEDVGPSDLYDPWGGRPVGLALMSGGAMSQAADFGEMFLMIGRATIVTEAVTVVNDGSDGGAAVIRARGRMAHLPFLDPVLNALLGDGFRDLEAAIDYSLAPGADTVDVTFHLSSGRTAPTEVGAVVHGFMYTDRMRVVVPGRGYTNDIAGATWAQFVDDDGASFAYRAADGTLGGSLARSGFVGAINNPMTIDACALTTRPHARLLIGGPGLDGLVTARARADGEALRTITGTVTGVPPAATVRVHAVDAAGAYLTRAPVGAGGAFTVHVPAAGAVTLTAVTSTGVVATAEVADGATTAALALPLLATLEIDRVVDDAGNTIPARVQVLPIGAGPPVTPVPETFGEEQAPDGRHEIAFHDGTPMRIPLRRGLYHVVVSRGPEYELYEVDIDMTLGGPLALAPMLDHVVATPGVQCGDFHIHTIRSNDAEDDAAYKVRSAMADGVEILARSDHEWVDDFQPLIEDRGWEPWVMGVGSVEMTSFELWGHMGVFPLEADPAAVNNGAPAWQTFPSAAAPDGEVVTLGPVEVFDAVRARPERPTVIINHPVGATNYFGYVGLDPMTGVVGLPQYWDDEFRLIEVFNDDGWHAKQDVVAAWFAILGTGRQVFAVGSSDSHSARSSPVGYPRTCIRLDTDDPRQLDGQLIRDRLLLGHATVAGGIYVDAAVGAAGPGDIANGTGPSVLVDLRVQAASWVDVDSVDVVVDGEIVETLRVTAADADPTNPAVRWHRAVPVDVAAAGSWVVFAAYGDEDLAPVHPGREAFGVTNPIFLRR